MFAKVKEDSKIKQVTACAGTQFFVDHYVSVPEGFEDEAKRNPYLDLVDELPEGESAKVESPLEMEKESPANPSDAPASDSSPKVEKPKAEGVPEKPKAKRRTTRKKSE